MTYQHSHQIGTRLLNPESSGKREVEYRARLSNRPNLREGLASCFERVFPQDPDPRLVLLQIADASLLSVSRAHQQYSSKSSYT